MNSQYSEENSMESHTDDDNSIIRQKSVMKTVLKRNKAASHGKPGTDESVKKGSHPQKDYGDPRGLCEQRYVWLIE